MVEHYSFTLHVARSLLGIDGWSLQCLGESAGLSANCIDR